MKLLRKSLVGAGCVVVGLSALGAGAGAAAPKYPIVVQKTRVDLDGDGDTAPGDTPGRAEILQTAQYSWALRVHVKSNVLTTPLETPEESRQPRLVAVGNVNGRRGDELFVNLETARDSIPGGQPILLYTYYHGQLVQADSGSTQLGVGDGSGPGVTYGVGCRSHGNQHLVVSREYESSFITGHPGWSERDLFYGWRHGHLHYLGRTGVHRITGAPRNTLTCGHTPVP